MCLYRLNAMRLPGLMLLAASFLPVAARGQSDAESIGPILGQEIISPAVAGFQLRQYLVNDVSPPPRVPQTAAQWTADAQRLRQHLLNDVVYHGWPKEWVDAPTKFEDMGVIAGGNGYKIRKLRYEIVPGFQSVALLYEPDNLQGKVPAILHVNGHVGPMGKAVEYKQKRCITFARHGVLSLNLEWFSFGELNKKENEHWFGAHLDLVGANELGLFYLAMRRGLDYLYDHPNVDRNRLGMTGLSGGGWQTIILSALDERVKVSVPVAGFSSARTRVEVREYGDLGDVEQSASDLLDGQDYTHLAAMMAPRPTQLEYDAEDDCCFRAPLVKSAIFDSIKPFFGVYGKQDSFLWHENRDPGTHNYQLDNRLQAYRFFTQQFGLPLIDNEEGVAPEIKSFDDLKVGLPDSNLTILGLARRLASANNRPEVPADASARAEWARSQREKLKVVVRYKPVTVASAWAVANTKNKGVETKSYLFLMSNGLAVSGVWGRAIGVTDSAPVTMVLDDKGKKAAGAAVAEQIDRGGQAVAVDLLFTGDAWTQPSPGEYAQFLHGLGERPIGMEAAQLIEVARWLQQRTGTKELRLDCSGIRSQTAALIAAALEPQLFSSVVVHTGAQSLSYLLQAPVEFHEAPDLFCLDLFKEFDLDRLAVVAGPARVTVEKYLELPKK